MAAYMVWLDYVNVSLQAPHAEERKDALCLVRWPDGRQECSFNGNEWHGSWSWDVATNVLLVHFNARWSLHEPRPLHTTTLLCTDATHYNGMDYQNRTIRCMARAAYTLHRQHWQALQLVDDRLVMVSP